MWGAKSHHCISTVATKGGATLHYDFFHPYIIINPKTEEILSICSSRQHSKLKCTFGAKNVHKA